MVKPSDIRPRKPVNKPTESVKDPKKPYVRKPYLTERPLKNHPDLLRLKKGLKG